VRGQSELLEELPEELLVELLEVDGAGAAAAASLPALFFSVAVPDPEEPDPEEPDPEELDPEPE